MVPIRESVEVNARVDELEVRVRILEEVLNVRISEQPAASRRPPPPSSSGAGSRRGRRGRSSILMRKWYAFRSRRSAELRELFPDQTPRGILSMVSDEWGALTDDQKNDLILD